MKPGTLVLAASLLFIPVSANNSTKSFKTPVQVEITAEQWSALTNDEEIVKYLKSLKINRIGNTMADIFQYEHRQIVKSISDELGIDQKQIYKLIYNESKGSTTITNPNSKAIGIIQWLPSTAKHYGTTTKEIKEMSLRGQLYLARLYFKDTLPKHKSYRNLQLALLCPKAVGKSDYYVVADSTTKYGKKVLQYYSKHDINNDNVITVEELLYKRNTQSKAQDLNVGRLDTEQITKV